MSHASDSHQINSYNQLITNSEKIFLFSISEMIIEQPCKPQYFCHGGTVAMVALWIVPTINFLVSFVCSLHMLFLLPSIHPNLPLTLRYFLCLFRLMLACAQPRWLLILVSYSSKRGLSQKRFGIFLLTVMLMGMVSFGA